MGQKVTRLANLFAVFSLAAAGAGAVAGCSAGNAGGSGGENVRDPGPTIEPRVRARQVAEAWDGSRAAETWRKGYFPVGDPVQLPENGFRNRDDERAYRTQNLTLRGSLPPSPSKGEVKWAHGDSLTLPLVGAREAYDAMAHGKSEGPGLVVTEVTLGETTQDTTRGPATVPAWLLRIEGYQTPIKRVALRPSKPPRSPIEPVRAESVSAEDLKPLAGLVDITEDSRSITVVAEHGDCDDGPVVEVLETGGSVVLMVSVRGMADGPCSDMLRREEVTVKLDRPVGKRVLLDAYTGRPVPSGTPYSTPNSPDKEANS